MNRWTFTTSVLVMVMSSLPVLQANAAGTTQWNLLQIAKRPYVAQVPQAQLTQALSDRAWQPATLQTDHQPGLQGLKSPKQHQAALLSLQYGSKRPYSRVDAESGL